MASANKIEEVNLVSDKLQRCDEKVDKFDMPEIKVPETHILDITNLVRKNQDIFATSESLNRIGLLLIKEKSLIKQSRIYWLPTS